MFKGWTKISLVAALLAGCGLNSPSLSGQPAGTGPSASGGAIEHGLGFNPQGARPYNSQDTLTFRGTLPETVDLRGQCSPVGDQGKLGSCTAWAMGNGLREFMELKQTGRVFTKLSPLYMYYKEREEDGTLGQDRGSTMSTGMKVLLETGDAPEADMPYDITKYNDPPSAKAETDAGEFKINKKLPLNNLDDMKASLAEGYPAVFGFIVYKSFKSIGADGVMPMPGFMEPRLGGHAVMAVGYNDTKQMLIVRNSWGSKWGDKGYFYMPYKFVGWGKVMDIWSAR